MGTRKKAAVSCPKWAAARLDAACRPVPVGRVRGRRGWYVGVGQARTDRDPKQRRCVDSVECRAAEDQDAGLKAQLGRRAVSWPAGKQAVQPIDSQTASRNVRGAWHRVPVPSAGASTWQPGASSWTLTWSVRVDVVVCSCARVFVCLCCPRAPLLAFPKKC
jgi:hypothetical protein